MITFPGWLYFFHCNKNKTFFLSGNSLATKKPLNVLVKESLYVFM